jgi:predicted glycosyltransferase involved in capsule biosynthesis
MLFYVTDFMTKIQLEDTTFVIPIRIDCFERLENIGLVLDYLTSVCSTNIIILEADTKRSGIIEDVIRSRAQYVFIEDSDPVFHRTRYLNILAGMVSTDHIAVWDSDVIVHPNQLYSSVNGLRHNDYDFVFPYDGNFLDIGVSHRIKFFENRNIDYLIENKDGMLLPYTSTACGGGFVARLSDYLECGGENENFYGWGQEDGERVERWKILEKKVRRTNGPMFHLYHPRGKNSKYLSEDHRNLQISEFGRICTMRKEQLRQEVSKWGNRTK